MASTLSLSNEILSSLFVSLIDEFEERKHDRKMKYN